MHDHKSMYQYTMSKQLKRKTCFLHHGWANVWQPDDPDMQRHGRALPVYDDQTMPMLMPISLSFHLTRVENAWNKGGRWLAWAAQQAIRSWWRSVALIG